MIRKMKRLVRKYLDILLLPLGWISYAFTGNTPQWAGHSLIQLFCMTGGRSNDLMARLVSMRSPPRKLDLEPGVLPTLSDAELKNIGSSLRDQGYFVLEQRVPDAICDQLLSFAMTQSSVLRPTDGQEKTRTVTLYDPANPLAVTYDFRKEDLLANPIVQSLMVDPTIVSVAQTYLGTEPVVDLLSMWWSTAFSNRPDGEAAQFYHFDMDRIKWLKFFIYLTDVGPENGPHFFVAGSHRTGGIPHEILKKGYARLSDDEVKRQYRPEDFIEFIAPRGTIIAEDTRGLHKGQHVRHGHRLMLQLQFSNSLFGPESPKSTLADVPETRLSRLAKRYPRMFSGYNFQR
jgi:hypothetical protein